MEFSQIAYGFYFIINHCQLIKQKEWKFSISETRSIDQKTIDMSCFVYSNLWSLKILRIKCQSYSKSATIDAFEQNYAFVTTLSITIYNWLFDIEKSSTEMVKVSLLLWIWNIEIQTVQEQFCMLTCWIHWLSFWWFNRIMFFYKI